MVSGVVDKNDTDVNSDSGKIMNLEFYDKQGYKYTARMSVHSISDAASDRGEFYVKLDDILDVNGDSIGIDNVTFGSGTTELTDSEGNTITDASSNTITNGAILKFREELDPTTGADTGAFEYVGSENGKTLTINFPNGFNDTSSADDAMYNFQDIEIDFSTTCNYNVNGSSTITAISGDDTGLGSGRKIGEMSGITIQKDGMIYASYDNGQSRLLGQIAVATFANPSGLEKAGDNLYSATMNSGEFDGIGEDITVGGGRMDSGVLEMSNVDLSAEFTEMITTQRGFQANSRIITVSDTLLEELTNLKR
jgi:flagellar hook protein FlgE